MSSFALPLEMWVARERGKGFRVCSCEKQFFFVWFCEEKRVMDGGQGCWARPRLNTPTGNICGPIVVNQCTVQ